MMNRELRKLALVDAYMMSKVSSLPPERLGKELQDIRRSNRCKASRLSEKLEIRKEKENGEYVRYRIRRSPRKAWNITVSKNSDYMGASFINPQTGKGRDLADGKRTLKTWNNMLKDMVATSTY